MRIRQKQLIEMLSFPDALTPQIAKINEKLVEAIKNGAYSIEEGTIDLGSLPEPLRVPYFLFIWFADLNCILHNLNLTLVDIEALRINHFILSGSPRQRFYLLLRTFFYEFYRAREIFNAGIKDLAKHGLIAPSEVQGARQMFHEAFEPAIKFRNLLVHSKPRWPGKANFNLNHIGVALEQGFAVQEIDSGQIIDIADVLKEVSDEYVPYAYRGIKSALRCSPSGNRKLLKIIFSNSIRVGRNNQRALRRMQLKHPVQCATLIAPYKTLSTAPFPCAPPRSDANGRWG